MLLPDLIINAASVTPNKLALISQESEYTYKEIFELSNQISVYLKSVHNLVNKNVIIHSCNSSDYILILFGLLMNKCTVIPVSITCTEEEINYIIDETKPTIVFIDDYCRKKYPNTYHNLTVNRLLISDVFEYMREWSTASKDSLLKESNLINLDEINNEVAFIIYSSGTSGDLKGVVCTHSAIMYAVEAINEIIKNNEEDKVLVALPFSFDYGLYQIFLVMMANGTAYIYNSLINALEIPSIIKKNKITGFPAIPMWLNLLSETNRIHQSKLESLRYITSTGDILKVNIIEELMEKIPNISVFSMYGLTECKRVSILSPEDFHNHKDSVGLPLKGTNVRIVDENGRDVKPNEPGELVVRGPHLMKSYYNDIEQTVDRYRYNEELREVELFTGDIFRMDDSGFLYFISRTQFFIKKRGQRISPRMVEALLNKIAGVLESVIVPVRGFGEERIACFIRLKEDCNYNCVVHAIHKTLPTVYLPDYIYQHDNFFPHNTNGKIDRKALMKLAVDLITQPKPDN